MGTIDVGVELARGARVGGFGSHINVSVRNVVPTLTSNER
jgi:hypothetical protein